MGEERNLVPQDFGIATGKGANEKPLVPYRESTYACINVGGNPAKSPNRGLA